ncbi:PARP domain-containing protein/RST domain-containing protein, partial [Cephalotus follicularis]
IYREREREREREICYLVPSPSQASTNLILRDMEDIEDYPDLFPCVIKLKEESIELDIIKKWFLKGMEVPERDTQLHAVYKILRFSGLMARWNSFRIFMETVKQLRGGNSNVKFAWYGGPKDEICRIITHGFSISHKPANGAQYGVGVCLNRDLFPIYGAVNAAMDRNGLRHMLLCGVILGNMEVVNPGSDQCHPSSNQFDSGVDNLTSPTRYIVWNAFMNSHIFPFYVVSFKAPWLQGSIKKLMSKALVPKPQPNSPYMSFYSLMSILSCSLAPARMALLTKSYSDFQERKITRQQMIRRLRCIAGDQLLSAVLKSYSNKASGNLNRNPKQEYVSSSNSNSSSSSISSDATTAN